MADVRIPTKFQGGFASLADLPDEEYAGLLVELDSAVPATYPPTLASKVARAFPDGREAVRSIVESVLTAAALSTSTDISSVARDLSSSPSLNLTKRQRDRLRTRILEVATKPSLILSVRANGYLDIDSNLYTLARASVEARPVFEAADIDAEPAIAGALVVYTLEIGFHSTPSDGKFVIVLDEEDVNALQGELASVQRQGAATRALVRSAGVTVFSNSEMDE